MTGIEIKIIILHLHLACGGIKISVNLGYILSVVYENGCIDKVIVHLLESVGIIAVDENWERRLRLSWK
jgi:hypothetical protein